MNRSRIARAGTVLLLAMIGLACSAGGSSDGGTGGSSCDKSKVQYAKCTLDTNCLSGNCKNGSCYVGTVPCASDAECQQSVSSAYSGVCFHDSTKNGCAF